MVDGPNMVFRHSEIPGGQGDKISQRGTVPLRGGRLTPMKIPLELTIPLPNMHEHAYAKRWKLTNFRFQHPRCGLDPEEDMLSFEGVCHMTT